jgi:hypothetical protein
MFFDWECELYRFVSKVIMFKKSLEFIKTIALCYSKQISPKVIRCVPRPLTWHISQIIIDILFLVVITCILN